MNVTAYLRGLPLRSTPPTCVLGLTRNNTCHAIRRVDIRLASVDGLPKSRLANMRLGKSTLASSASFVMRPHTLILLRTRHDDDFELTSGPNPCSSYLVSSLYATKFQFPRLVPWQCFFEASGLVLKYHKIRVWVMCVAVGYVVFFNLIQNE